MQVWVAEGDSWRLEQAFLTRAEELNDRPVPHKSNGYADLTIRSAEEVYDYLKSVGATFPRVEGINGQPGIDPQPGYRQILAVDSEGNLIDFSEYSEY